jgi:ribonuclease D
MTQLPPDLARLGDALERAATADLAAARREPARQRGRASRRVVLAIAALAILVPGVAIAANQLTSTSDVAQSMPAGTLALAGTVPTCTIVTKDIEFHCVLAKAPAPEISDWMRTVEPTVDASKHVNGGCRSLASDGKEWECYLGQKAVDEQIIGSSLLGAFAPTPGAG